MAQSIQRGSDWWNQRPDGVWLKWSAESQSWVPQSAGPPPPSPDAPDSPFSTAETRPAEFPPLKEKVSAKNSTRSQRAAGIPTEESKPKKQSNTAPQAVQESPEEPTTRPAANKPTFSAGSRGLPPIRENKVLLSLVGGLLILGAFVGTYIGATAYFAKGSSVASAHEKVETPKGFTKEKWTYVLKMDQHCRDFNSQQEFEEMVKRLQVVESEEELLALVEEFRAQFLEGVSAFRQGPLPKQDRKILNKILALHRTAGEWFDRMIAAIQNQDLAALQSITIEAVNKGKLEMKLMNRYGFQACGNNI